MKKLVPQLILLCANSIILATGNQEFSTDDTKKQSITCYGTLISDSNNTYEIEDILLDNKMKHIEVYEIPSNEKFVTIDHNLIKLKIDPKKSGSEQNGGTLVRAELDLVDQIKEIDVPSSRTIWAYNADKNVQDKDLPKDPRSHLYIEIEVTNNNGKKENYLIERNKKLIAIKVDDVPLESYIPAIKKLTIKGCKQREIEIKKTQLKKKSVMNEHSQRKTRAAHHKDKRKQKILAV